VVTACRFHWVLAEGRREEGRELSAAFHRLRPRRRFLLPTRL